ncbi:MgtC/SapB family protein [Sphingomonas sp.]|uniref:MgtC/SapB family protein n=1 Tax=Sphingomonas sp. TaxID=28214 RepID=UPI003B00FD86
MAAEWGDMLVRLGVATLAGAVLGWERSRQNRAIMGLRTLTLVALASCIAVQAIVHSGLPQMNADAAGRVVQGVLSGVGFIGAGALLHGGNDSQVHGLATAASIWVAAAMGAAAALAVWPLLVGGTALAIVVLLIGASIERHIRDRARASNGEQDRRDMTDRP